MSVAGGLYKGIQRAVAVGCQCVQIFTKNNNQWNAKPLTDADVDAWRGELEKSGLVSPIAHASYLINLATPDEELWAKSIDALTIELQRADQLGLSGLVLHPGAFTTSDEIAGLRRVVAAAGQLFARYTPHTCRLLLENTAGQGSCLGHSFAQLGYLWDAIAAPAQLGFCFDTCHAFAAGYDLRTAVGFAAMRKELTDAVPIDSIKALHLNDSLKDCGSRVDRHQHIGQGKLGQEAFVQVFADPIFCKLPGYLETPKGTDPGTGEDYDSRNLTILRKLAAKARAS